MLRKLFFNNKLGFILKTNFSYRSIARMIQLCVYKNALAYFATTVSYSRKMFMKLTPGGVDAPTAMAVCGGMATIFLNIYFHSQNAVS